MANTHQQSDSMTPNKEQQKNQDEPIKKIDVEFIKFIEAKTKNESLNVEPTDEDTISTSVEMADCITDSISDNDEPNDDDKDCTDRANKYVILDIGGERFKAKKVLFLKYPQTRLGKLINSVKLEEILSLCEEFIPGSIPEYFFDKNPENFPSVLEMYRSGDFHIQDNSGGGCQYFLFLILEVFDFF